MERWNTLAPTSGPAPSPLLRLRPEVLEGVGLLLCELRDGATPALHDVLRLATDCGLALEASDERRLSGDCMTSPTALPLPTAFTLTS